MLFDFNTHVPSTTVAPKLHAPTSPPRPIKIPSVSPPAVTEDIISGAPLANASNVQPAMASLNLIEVNIHKNFFLYDYYFRNFDILVRTGVRYWSAVWDSR